MQGDDLPRVQEDRILLEDHVEEACVHRVYEDVCVLCGRNVVLS